MRTYGWFAATVFLGLCFGEGPARGVDWTTTTVPFTNWYAVACSVDGAKVVAVVDNPPASGVWISTDAGLHWTQTTAPAAPGWSSVASSTSGSKLAASGSGGVFLSADSGATWTLTSAPVSAAWLSIARSADGTNLVVAGPGSISGGIYISQPVVPPTLAATHSGRNIVLSWPPASGFMLQQTLDLATANWTDVAGSPLLTNLRFEVTLPLTNNAAFFRLRHP